MQGWGPPIRAQSRAAETGSEPARKLPTLDTSGSPDRCTVVAGEALRPTGQYLPAMQANLGARALPSPARSECAFHCARAIPAIGLRESDSPPAAELPRPYRP